jgi:hypothetical protein
MTLARVLAASLALIALAACEEPPAPKVSRPSDTPEVASASPAPWPTLRLGKGLPTGEPAAPSSSAVASAAPPSSADPAPSASSSAAPAARVGASSSAAGGASSAPSASAAADASAQPNPKTGILGKGVADKILKLGSSQSVKLLEPGEEPREALSYALTKGMKQPLKMSLDISTSMKSAERSLPTTTLPRMSVVLDLSAGESDAAGDWKIDANLGGLELEPKGAAQEAMAAQMRPNLAGSKGVSLSYWVSPHGAVRDVKVNLTGDTPAGAKEALASVNQSFESMVAPLPREKVGVGAKWEVVTRMLSSGADILQYATYTLKSREGTKAALDVSIKQLAATAAVKMPGLPAGFSTRMRSFKSGGTGAMSIDTKQMAPDSGRLALKMVLDLQITQPRAAAAGGLPGEDSQTATTENSMTVSFSRP